MSATGALTRPPPGRGPLPAMAGGGPLRLLPAEGGPVWLMLLVNIYKFKTNRVTYCKVFLYIKNKNKLSSPSKASGLDGRFVVIETSGTGPLPPVELLHIDNCLKTSHKAMLPLYTVGTAQIF